MIELESFGLLDKFKEFGKNINGIYEKSKKFEDLNKMSVGKESRTRILNKIIDYYSLHLQMFKTPKSINVFAEVFK